MINIPRLCPYRITYILNKNHSNVSLSNILVNSKNLTIFNLWTYFAKIHLDIMEQMFHGVCKRKLTPETWFSIPISTCYPPFSTYIQNSLGNLQFHKRLGGQKTWTYFPRKLKMKLRAFEANPQNHINYNICHIYYPCGNSQVNLPRKEIASKILNRQEECVDGNVGPHVVIK